MENEHAEKPVLSPLEKQAFGRALVHYRSGEFGAAAKLLEALIEGFPESGNLSNVYYWLAESYSELKENGKALAKYETMLAKYPKAPKKADALLKLAGIYHRVSRPDKAQEIYRDLVIRFPNSAYAKIAQRHLVSGDKGGSVP